MIGANQLPKDNSVYELPNVVDPDNMTPEQQQQALTAKIAGIVMAVAATKSSLKDAATNQVVALIHTADLTTKAGIKAFAKSAALIVSIAVRQAQEVTWAGVKMRTELLNINFSASLPRVDEMPSNLASGRATDLERAYERIATEYQENLKRKADDPIIQELVKQFEDEGQTPLLRPDNISSDAIERVTDGKKDWADAFAETISEEGGEEPEGPSDEEISKDSLEARRIEREAELEKFASAVESARKDVESKRTQAESEYKRAVAEEEQQRIEAEQSAARLEEAEIRAIIRRYAEQKAGERAERMIGQDIAGASRNVYNLALDDVPNDSVLGYRRVVHPELSESGQSCGLCIVASTMEYKRGDLLPIHSGCNCEVCEIYSFNGKVYDPGHLINMEDLEVFYREAKNSTSGWDLKKSRYEVVNHPEYGPTLINAHPNKTGKVTKEYVKING